MPSSCFKRIRYTVRWYYVSGDVTCVSPCCCVVCTDSYRRHLPPSRNASTDSLLLHLIRPLCRESDEDLRPKILHGADFTQVTVAGLIMANFVANICESSVKPSHQSQKIFDGVDLVFTAIFTAELLVNMFATVGLLALRFFASCAQGRCSWSAMKQRPLTCACAHARTETDLDTCPTSWCGNSYAMRGIGSTS